MNSFRALASMLVVWMLLSNAAVAQNVTVNPGAGSYPTLKDAFDAINAGTHTGALAVTVGADTTETASAVLNASGSGAADYTSISITPVGARSISGAIAAGSPLIDFNGADNITIDGLNSGGNSLTIANTTVSGTAGTSTIRMINDASGNTIQNASVNGSGTGTATGTFIFGNTTGATGNDNNTITACNIGPNGSALPSNAVLSGGTTTSLATRNSGIVVSNSNIYDFFNASAVANGILATGSTDWTITGNNIYQTGTRTFGVASTGFIGISLSDTTGVNFLVADNFIGGSAPAAGGTAWTQTGAFTHTFIGIRLSVGTAVASSVQNNTIRNLSISTSTTSSVNAGISAVTGAINVGTVTGNTIGSVAATGSITWVGAGTGAQLTGVLAGTGTPGVIAISNNSIGGIAISGTGTTIFRGINTQLAATSYLVSNNTIGSTSIANSISNSTNNTVAGIISSSTSTSVTITGNTIANLTTTGTSTANTLQGIVVSGGSNTITNNIVRNLSSSSIATGTGSTAGMNGISMATTTLSPQTVSGNTVHSLSNSAATAAVVVNGIYYAGGTAGTNAVERNLVHSLAVASTGSAVIRGIFVFNGSAAYRNNMIRLGLDAAGASLTSGNLLIEGFRFDAVAGSVNLVNFNSVYIGGTGVGAGATNTFGYVRITTETNSDIRNNIFVNNRSNGAGTGKHYLISLNALAGVTVNANNYHQTGVGSVFGVAAGADAASFAAWKTATSQDGASFFTDPMFLNPTGTAASGDLHINPVPPTVVEGNGVLISPPLDDFDGQIRSGLTPVDIGADAGNFNGIDLAAPAISYSALGNTTSTANRSLAATITDVTGVPTSGIGVPVIYYRKGVAGAFVSTQATSGGGSSYNFTIDYALVTGGGVAAGDTIQYYVVAQDTAAIPNVGANPSGGAAGFSADPPAAATPPSTPNSYQIAFAITGARTVCASGCDYPTLTGAGGAFAALNSNVATGNIELQIAGDLVAGEDGSNALNARVEEPANSNYTLRIYPTGAPRVIVGARSAGPLIRFAASSRSTIDGSLGGIGSERSLSIENTSVTTPQVISFASVGATPITDSALRNCLIINGVNTSSAVVINDIAGTAGLFSNITIQNNSIQKAYIGVFANGITSPPGAANLVYTQNTLDASGANAIRNVGLYVQGVNGATVSQNTLGNFSNVEGENDYGIWLATGTGNTTVSGNTVSNLGMTLTTAFAPYGIRESSGLALSGNSISGNTVSNLSTSGTTAVRGIASGSGGVTIEANKIQGIINSNTTTYGAFGIDVIAGNDTVIRNNFVSEVNHDMSGGGAFDPNFGVVGIRLGAGTGHRVYHNSVNLFGPHTGTPATNLLSAAFSISTTAQTGIDVRNNIFANNITGGTTGIAHVSVYLPSAATSAMNLTWNNNSYYFGADAARQGVGQAGTTPSAPTFANLSALAAYTSTLSAAGTNDSASLAQDTAVPFLSATDLHLPPTPAPATGAGVGVTTDIDNDPRPVSAPAIGADELPSYSVGGTVSGLSGSGLVLQNNSGDNLGVSANGSFTFSTSLSSGSAYSVTVLTQPTSPPQTCVVGNASGTIAAANVTDVTVTCTTNSYTVGGSVTGLSGTGLVLRNNGGDGLAIAGNGAFTFATPLVSGATYDVTVFAQPGGPAQTCVVSSGSGTIVSADITDVAVNCTTNTYTVGGSVTGLIGSGLVLRNNGGDDLSIAGNGAFTFATPVASGGTYLVTVFTQPGSPAQSCSVSNGNGTIAAANVANVLVTCATDSYTVGGNVTGLTGSGLVLRNNGGDSLSISANGAFTFASPVASGATYAVTVFTQPGSPAQTCVVSNGSGTVGAANITDVAVNCTTNTYTVGGSVTGLTGSGLVLRNNGGDNLTISANGAFTFATQVASGATYAVTVFTQPSSPTQTCTVSNGSGTVAGANITNVAVSCALPSADLSITKTANEALIGSGMIQYTITVANAGPSAVTGATVTDTFPAQLSGATWTCSGLVGATCTANGTGNISQLVNLPMGGSVIFSVTANIVLPLPSSISNTATVAVPAGTTDPNLANNSSTAITVIVIFANGFEDAPPPAPDTVKLGMAAPGVYSGVALPIADVRTLARSLEPVEVIRFQVQDSLMVVQTRLLGELAQVRVVQINAPGHWAVSDWTDLDQAQGLSFDWVSSASGQPQARLRPVR